VGKTQTHSLPANYEAIYPHIPHLPFSREVEKKEEERGGRGGVGKRWREKK
jgi:hypothetical protein